MKIKLKFVGVGVLDDPRSEGLLNKKAGITLISLVITVIVLLILAGAAVTIALNGDSIFSKANKAVTEWNTKTSQEESALSANMATLNEYFRVTSDQKVIVTSDPVKGTYTTGNVTVTLKYGENNDAIPTDYVMQYQEKASENADPGDWTAYTAPMTVETQGKYIRGRLYNSTLDADAGTSEWFIVDNIDRENPSAPTAIAKISSTDTSITVQASGGNDDSGTWLYEYKIGDEAWSTAKATTETHTFTGLTAGNTYTIQARTKDVAGKYSATTKSVNITLRTAPIPSGYKVSIYPGETSIEDGLVIYQTTNNLVADTGNSTTNHDYAMANYNQFVWIPVDDINSMIMCKNNTSSSRCNIILEDGELKCTTHTTTGAANMCGRLYGVNSTSTTVNNQYIYSTSMNFSDRTQTFSANSGYREPDLVTTYDKDANSSYFATAGMTTGNQTAAKFLEQLQTDFYAMAKSVALNKGFYIGRYEAGYDSSTYTSKKGQVVMNASTTANVGANMWYGLYNHLRTSMGSLNSQMIWGCQYDQTIKFIKENKGTNDLDPEIGHTDIGLKTSKDVSGATGVNDIMKNIYDLEGNVLEWTAQAYYTDSRVYRGGYYGDVGYSYFNPASHRRNRYPTGTSDIYGSRSGLYL